MSGQFVLSAEVLLSQPLCGVPIKDVSFIGVICSVVQVWFAGQEPHGDVGMKEAVKGGRVARHEDEDVCGVSTLKVMPVAVSNCFMEVLHHVNCSALMDE